MDVVDSKTRSRMMASIRSKNTKPELLLRRALHKKGLRFRLHRADLPGHPDLVLSRHRAVIFVHGCFWHRHNGCKLASMPSTNIDFWSNKFLKRVARDCENLAWLEMAGWRVAIIWECSTRPMLSDATVDALSEWLRSTIQSFETKVPIKFKLQQMKNFAKTTK